MTIQDIVDKGKKVILFGAAQNGITRFLFNKEIPIVKFIDNDKRKHGKLLYGKMIDSVLSLTNQEKADNIVIISTYTHCDEMEAQLQGEGINNYIVAVRDIEDFKSTSFQAFCQGINVEKLEIDTVHIELSGYCNCKCIYCPFHGIPNIKEKYKNFMSWKTIKKVVEQMKSISTIRILNVVGSGEIFLNNDWFEMISYIVKELKIEKLVMYTNGMLLDENRVRKIQNIEVNEIELEISIDGQNPEDNERYRIGSVYSVVKQNVLRAAEILNGDSRIRILITNCYPVELNSIQKNDKMSQDVDIPMFIKNDFGKIDAVSKRTLGLSSYKIPGFKIIEQQWKNNSDVCLDIFHQIAIDANGKLLRCSCWNAAIEQIADVYKDNLIDIWYNDQQLVLARKHFIDKNSEKDFCEGCPIRGMGSYCILAKE